MADRTKLTETVENTRPVPRPWKQRIADEMTEYAADVAYLFFFLGMFSLYRRLLLAEYQISYLHYGITLIEALVLAKILMVGRMLRLDRGFEQKPLIVPTIYKALIFSLLVGAFTVIETAIEELIHRGGAAAVHEPGGRYALIGRVLVSFFALIPFFGLKEVGRVLGKGKLLHLVIRGRQPQMGSDGMEELSRPAR